MNPRTALDWDALIEQLSRLDSSDPGDAAIEQPPSTVRELKAELETLVSQLRQPVEPEPFADETGLRRAQELVLAIGLEPDSKIPTEQPELGRIGPYELLEKLGQGGMGAVYKALHSSLEKIVALKVLPRDRLTPAAIARFKREMKAVGKLDHPNIVRATDAGEADGDHFLVMEYVEGVDLAELLRRVGTLPAADACELVRQAAVGLQHAHQRGMVHRDIKPNNIMLAWGDEHAPAVKVLDMGLALINEQKSPAQGDLTTTGQMMGTLEYMSPEQGLDTHNVDIRADIYSLGASLYKLLCGKAPFSGERYNTPGKLMVALATETPPSIGTLRNELPAGLIALVDRMLAREVTARPSTPAEVAQALVPFATGADLRRLADVTRHHGMSSDRTSDQSITPTEQFLSSPSTGTSPTLKPESQPRDLPATPSLPLQASLRTPHSAFRTPKGLAAIAAGFLAVAMAVFGIIKISTSYGDYVILTDDPDFSFSVSNDVVTLHDKKTKREYAMKVVRQDNGVFELDVTDVGADLSFKTKEFTIKRGQQVALKAHFERKSAEVAKGSPATNPDRCAAEYVLSVGGTVKVKGSDGQEPLITSVEKLPLQPFQLTLVNLQGNPKVADAGLAVFSGCKSLEYLQLDNTSVSDAGLAHFQGCKNLAGLTVGNQNISDVGLAHFQNCSNLTELILSGCDRVTDVGLAHFKECKNLQRLTLTGTQVTDVGLSYFKNCPNLYQLWLTEAPNITDSGLVHFKDCPKLITLDLRNTPTTDAGLAHFAACPNLTNLSLGGTKITNAGLAHFAACTKLRGVFLDNNRQVSIAALAHFRASPEMTHFALGLRDIGDDDLVVFREWKQLTMLGFGASSVTDAGLNHLKECKNLTLLRLRQSKITASGVDGLRKALPLCRIEWDGGVIEPTVSSDRNVAEWLLSIGGEFTYPQDGELRLVRATDRLPEAAFHIDTIGLAENQRLVDGDLERLAGLSKLQSLYLFNTAITDDGLEHLKKLPALRNLFLGGTRITNVGLAKLREAPLLSSLTLSNTKITDEGLGHLLEFKQLSAIDLSHTAITDVGLKTLAQSKQFTVLTIGNTKITDSGLKEIAAMKQLTALELYAASITDAGLDSVRQLPNLNFLGLSGTEITDDGLLKLREMKTLISVDVRSLEVRANKVTADGVKKLAATLPKCRIYSDHGTFEPTAAINPDRRAAEFILSIPRDFGIKVQVNDVDRWIGKAADLPAEPFRLTGVFAEWASKLDDARLVNF